MAATKMRLKLLVDKSRNKVLFAESGKDFVNFLFSLLRLRIGTIVRLLTATQTTTGCIGNLYTSVDNLDNLYMLPNVDKSLLLQPKDDYGMRRLFMTSDLEDEGKSSQRINEPMKTPPRYYYHCSRFNSTCWKYVTDVNGASCGGCGGKMTTEMHFVEGQGSATMPGNGGGCTCVGGEGGGYVKEVMTYMITDDLEVKPLSTISSIAIFNRYGVKDVGILEDKVVHFGTEEGLDLLRASLQSKSVLTDIFLKNEIKSGLHERQLSSTISEVHGSMQFSGDGFGIPPISSFISSPPLFNPCISLVKKTRPVKFIDTETGEAYDPDW